jgi:hypothetical protein
MATRTSLLALAFSAAALVPALAYEGRTYSSTTRQTGAEVEDIGVIAESSATVDAKGDGKSTPPPPAPSRLRLNVGVSPRFTSNAQLSGDHKSADFLLLPNLEAGYKVPFGHGFALDNIARIESGVYARYDERTFIGYSWQSTLEWRPKPGLPRLFVGAEPYRLDRFNSQDCITQAVALSAGTDWGYGFNNGNSLFFIGYAFTDHLSDPDIDSRINHSVTTGVAHLFTKRLLGQVYYQYQHDNYQSLSRDDDRHVTGVSLTYQLDRHWFATLSASLADNDSTQRKASYQSAGAGFSINYQY